MGRGHEAGGAGGKAVRRGYVNNCLCHVLMCLGREGPPVHNVMDQKDKSIDRAKT